MPEHSHADGCPAVLVHHPLGTPGPQALSGAWPLLSGSSCAGK